MKAAFSLDLYIEAFEGWCDSGGDGRVFMPTSIDILEPTMYGVAAIDGDCNGECNGLSRFLHSSAITGGNRGVVAWPGSDSS